jgi:aspartyl/asparaginyl beta-hydroxylase (cupin superfamily)
MSKKQRWPGKKGPLNQRSTLFEPPAPPRSPAAVAREHGLRALQQGEIARALPYLEEAAALEPDSIENQLNLGVVKRALGDRAGELAAINRVLEIEPRALVALLLKGAHFADQDNLIEAGQAFSAALAVAPPLDRIPTDLHPLMERAKQVQTRFIDQQSAILDRHTDPIIAQHTDARLERFQQSVDVYLGRKAIYHREPHSFYYPGLAEVQFYDRRDFPWLAEIEAATPKIREEFLAILARDEGFVPYVQFRAGRPLDQWAELNHNPRWSAYHLYENGTLRPEHAALCPVTMGLLAKAPSAQLPKRSPCSMFSVLQPHTRIPPHTGVTNVRLVVHIPLIIPDGCWYRVGNDVRPWKLGEAFIFDDTIEHEAVNDSDHVRVVLIFDIWHPDISAAEQELIGAFFNGVDDFMGEPD